MANRSIQDILSLVYDSATASLRMTGDITVPGADKNIIFNDGGVLGAEAAFSYNKATNELGAAFINCIGVAAIDPTATPTVGFSAASGLVGTPVTLDGYIAIRSSVFTGGSTNGVYGASGGFTSTGMLSGKKAAGVLSVAVTKSTDDAAGIINGFEAVLDTTDGGSSATSAFSTLDLGGGVWDNLINSSFGADITAYKALNNGNPAWKFGASATEALEIKTFYDVGTQTLSTVEFNTYTASASTNFGQYQFKVDESLILIVDDDGVIVNGAVKGLTSINTQTGISYQLDALDQSKLVTLTNAAAVTLTVPTNAVVPFQVGTSIDLVAGGLGLVTVTPAGGVTINSVGGLTNLNGQYAGATLTKTATDVWLLVGNLS